MHEDRLLPGRSVRPAWFGLSPSECILLLANEIVMIYPLCSDPLCGLAWIEVYIYPQHVTSDCDCTCTQTSLGGGYKQANRKDRKRDKSCQHPMIPRNRTWISVHYRAQLLSITEEISKVKRHDMTKPELERGLLPPRTMWSGKYLPLSPNVKHEQLT